MRLLTASLLIMFSAVAGLWAGEAAAIQNKRVALFYDEQFQALTKAMAKQMVWCQETLAGMGLKVTTINAKELCDEARITRGQFDTVFLPDGSIIPLKAEYTLAAFLAEGGNVVLGELPVEARVYDEEKGAWGKTYRQDFYTFYSDLQIRRCGSLREKGLRSLNVSLTRNAQLPEDIQSRLPPLAGPFASNEWFQILDRMENNFEGGRSKDMVIAGNIFWPVYTLPGGEQADFVGYRYHNRTLNGSTLVLLGRVGRNLLKTDSAAGVIYTAFKLCELPFPGEQSAEFYNRLFEVQRGISRLSEEYVTVGAALSDAATAAFYGGQSKRYSELKDQLVGMDKEFFDLLSENRKADALLMAATAPEQQDKIRKDILAGIKGQVKRMKVMLKGVKRELRAIRRPDKVAVANKQFDALRVDAATCIPIGYYMYRKHFFQALKQLNVNTVHARERMREYLRDPQIRKNSAGISFIIRVSAPSLGYSKFDPVAGTITETKDGDKPEDNEKIKQKFPEFMSLWKGLPIYRFYYSDALLGENGVDTMYWGEKAKKDYREYLTKQYATIQALNRRWAANYSSFGDIPAPMGQPQTEPEHANWEDWTVFRDQVYLQKIKSYYDLSKQYAPDIPVSVCMSITALRRPYAGGNNLYNYTKYQDISGMDGAYLDVGQEWTWFDLTRGIPHYTTENGIYYNPSPDPRQWKNKLTAEMWAEFSGGDIGYNCRVWSSGGCSANSVDTTGLPTLGGWTLKRMIEQASRIEHIILDGERPADIRILYSNTCRRHDQGWISGSWSRHHVVVNNLYYMFRRWQRPTRVLAEEALNEGKDISSCKLLLVPQAEYLKEATQDRLLEYARGGGNVLVEGYSGKLDNYGHPSAKLFAAANVKCLPASSDLAVIDGEESPLGSSESVYRMEAEKGAASKVLIQYADKSPAVVSCPLGKGRLIFSGIPFGLLNMNDDARRIMDGVNAEIGLVPKYTCKDARLVLREWKYRDQTYLICTYPYAHDDQLQECALKIRGAYKVQDYLLGMEVPSRTDKKDTLVHFVMPVPGVQVFRLDPLTAEQLAQIDAAALGDVPAEQTASTKEEQMHMPYKGFIYESCPVEVDGYKIEVNVIRRGEADLIIRKGAVTVRQRIAADKANSYIGSIEDAKQYELAVGESTLMVYSKAISEILPVGADIEIKETKEAASGGRAERGLAGGWRFNTGSGDRIGDISPFGSEARIIGGKWLKKNGNVLMLNGSSNDYVNCGTNGSLDISGPITLEAWVNGVSGKDGSMRNGTIVSRGTQYWLQINCWGGGGSVCYWYWGKKSKAWVHWSGSWTGNGLGPHQWCHVVVVNDFVSAPRMYLNGELSKKLWHKGSVITKEKPVGEIEENVGTGGQVLIGRYGQGRYDFRGMIGSVAIYNTCLTEEDVVRHYRETEWMYK